MNLLALNNERPRASWLRKVGTFGFMFFLVKGLLWLAFAYVAQSFI